MQYSDFGHVCHPNNGKTGFGVVVPGKNIMMSKRTSDKLSVYTVEMLAILMALQLGGRK